MRDRGHEKLEETCMFFFLSIRLHKNVHWGKSQQAAWIVKDGEEQRRMLDI